MNTISNKKCILICAGELDIKGLSLDIAPGDFVIVADGGIKYLDSLCLHFGIKPDLVIGDFDSADENAMKWVREFENNHSDAVITLPSEKDDTDTMAAVREGLRRGYKEFVILGGFGGRMDHYLANIQTLLFIKHHGGNASMLDGSGMVTVLENEESTFNAAEGSIFSMFALGERATVSIKGLKYETEELSLSNDFPIGVSNEFIGKDARITVKNGAAACILYLQKH